MSLTDGEYLLWYCEEITRYRNIEWKVCGYAGAFSLGVIYLASDVSRKSIIMSNKFFAISFLLIFSAFLFWSELHIHRKLNLWRKKRDALVLGKSEHKKIRSSLINRTLQGKIDYTDFFYFIAFEAFIIGMPICAIIVILFPARAYGFGN